MLIQDVHVQVHQPSRARIAFSANAVTVPVTAGFVQASKFRESWNLSVSVLSVTPLAKMMKMFMPS